MIYFKRQSWTHLSMFQVSNLWDGSRSEILYMLYNSPGPQLTCICSMKKKNHVVVLMYFINELCQFLRHEKWSFFFFFLSFLEYNFTLYENSTCNIKIYHHSQLQKKYENAVLQPPQEFQWRSNFPNFWETWEDPLCMIQLPRIKCHYNVFNEHWNVHWNVTPNVTSSGIKGGIILEVIIL